MDRTTKILIVVAVVGWVLICLAFGPEYAY